MKVFLFLDIKEKGQCVREEDVIGPKFKIMMSAHALYLCEDGVMTLVGKVVFQ